jgi:hypothetical protein
MHSKARHLAGSRSAARVFAAAAVACASFLSACSTHIGDIQSPIALPASTPDRPAAPYTYPAVHDMPPDRPAPMMSEEQQEKLEADLVAARNRQTGAPAPKPSAKKPKAPAQSPGSTPNP